MRHTDPLQVLERQRQPRTCRLNLESPCMCSTAHLRWTTAPWGTSSRDWLHLVVGAALMSSTGWCQRCSVCAVSSTSVSLMHRSARACSPAGASCHRKLIIMLEPESMFDGVKSRLWHKLASAGHPVSGFMCSCRSVANAQACHFFQAIWKTA